MRFLLSGLIFCSFFVQAAPMHFKASAETEKMVEDALRQQIEAANKNDLEYFKNSEADEVVMIGTNSKEFNVGRGETIKDVGEWSKKYEMLHPKVVKRIVSQKGDLVWVSAIYNSVARERATGKTVEYPGIRSTSLYIIEDKKLKLLQGHSSNPDDSRP